MRETLSGFIKNFAPIDDSQCDKFTDLFEPMPVKRLDYLYREGDNIKKLYYIHSGVMRGYYLKDGVEHTTSFYFGPTLMTDMFTVRDNTPTLMYMQALKDCECYVASFEAVEKLADEHLEFYKAFYKLYEFLFMFMVQRQISFIYDTPRERYLKLFKEHPNVIAKIPLRYIASYLGIKPESLSRIRKNI